MRGSASTPRAASSASAAPACSSPPTATAARVRGAGGQAGASGAELGPPSLSLCPADTDECLATPCQHRCKNSVGSYRCSCRPGYHLHGNRHSCVGERCAPAPLRVTTSPRLWGRGGRRHGAAATSSALPGPCPRRWRSGHPCALHWRGFFSPVSWLLPPARAPMSPRVPQMSTSAGGRETDAPVSTPATTPQAATCAPAAPGTGSAVTGSPVKVTGGSSCQGG